MSSEIRIITRFVRDQLDKCIKGGNEWVSFFDHLQKVHIFVFSNIEEASICEYILI